MKYTNVQKIWLRKKLKEFGYGCRINEKMSPFSDKIVTFISFILPDKKVVKVTGCGVWDESFYREHKVAFEIISEFIKNEKGV